MENPVQTVLAGEAVTIDDLFCQDPETLSDKDIDTLIHYLRSRRAEWEQDEAKTQTSGARQTTRAAGTPRKTAGKVKLADVLGDDLLDDLLDEQASLPSLPGEKTDAE